MAGTRTRKQGSGQVVKIVASRGRFRTVKEASRSEKRVKWFVPDPDADAVTECFAAVELADGISRLLEHAGTRDVAIGFASPGRKIAGDGLRIVLGTPASNPLVKALEARGAMKGVKNDEGYLILAAREDAGEVLYIAARTRKGVLNGVYRYMEELGMGWTSPDQPQAVWPKRVTLWRKGMRMQEAPRFDLRGFWMEKEHQITKELLTWMARNRMNYGGSPKILPAFAKKLGIRVVTGGDETHYCFMPDQKFARGATLFDAHPEWFALRNGERQAWPGLLCTSNRDAVDYLFDNVMGRIMKHAAWLDEYGFGGSDTGKTWCECPGCRPLGNASDRYLLLVHELRRRLDAEHEKGNIDHRIVIQIEAYDGGDNLRPPSKPLPKGFDVRMTRLCAWPIRRCYSHSLADPQCREMNMYQWKNLKGWLRIFKGPAAMGAFYNVSAFVDMATVFSRCMFDDLRDHLAAGFTGMQYMHVSPGHWGPRALTNWQLARLTWEPKRDYDSMLRDFFRLRFGSAAGRAERLYRKLDQAMSNITPVKSVLLGNLNWNLRRDYGDYAAPEWDNAAGCAMIELFHYDHLKLHRPKGSDGKMGYGLDNLDDIVKALESVEAGLRRLRREAGLSKVTRANLDEDVVLVSYTGLLLSLHRQFALYWEANRHGKGNAGLHRRRLLAIVDKLAGKRLPAKASAYMVTLDSLGRSSLLAPLKREFGYNAEAQVATLKVKTGLVV